MRFLRYVTVLFLLLPALVPAEPTLKSFDRGVYESVPVPADKPRILSLSQIEQSARGSNFYQLYNADEESREQVEEFLKPQVPPVQIPMHFDAEDLPSRPVATNLKAWTASAPALKTAFAGIAPTGTGQPDSMITVGPSRVMVAVNTSVAIYNKLGARRFQTTFDQWFAPLADIAGGSTLFDPQLIYDQYQGHYIFLCNARRSDHRSWYLLSVSKTSNPEGDWAFWAVDMQLTGGVRPDLWADFPRLGVDSNAVYLTANMYTFRTYIFRYGKIRVLKKSELYAFGKLTTYEFSSMVDATGAFARNIHAAHCYGGTTTGYLVNTRNDAGSKITVWAVSNTTTKPVLTRIDVSVSSYQAPPEALQKGGGAVINTATEGTGALSATFRGGFLYTAHAISHNWGSGSVSAIRFYQIDPKGIVKQEVTYGSDGLSYYMPAVTVNNKGDVVLVFNRSGKAQFAGIYYAGRRATDPLGAFSPSVVLHPGESNYGIVFKGTNIARWGDYNAIAVDNSNQTFWMYSEFVKHPDEWNTVIGQAGY